MGRGWGRRVGGRFCCWGPPSCKLGCPEFVSEVLLHLVLFLCRFFCLPRPLIPLLDQRLPLYLCLLRCHFGSIRRSFARSPSASFFIFFVPSYAAFTLLILWSSSRWSSYLFPSNISIHSSSFSAQSPRAIISTEVCSVIFCVLLHIVAPAVGIPLPLCLATRNCDEMLTTKISPFLRF